MAEVNSPGTSLWGTGLSSTPKTGSPVNRFKMNTNPSFPVCTSAGIFFPLTVMSIRMGAGGRSISHKS